MSVSVPISIENVEGSEGFPENMMISCRVLKLAGKPQDKVKKSVANRKFNFKRTNTNIVEAQDSDDERPQYRLRQNFDDYLESDDSSSSGDSRNDSESSDLNISVDDEELENLEPSERPLLGEGNAFIENNISKTNPK